MRIADSGPLSEEDPKLKYLNPIPAALCRWLLDDARSCAHPSGLRTVAISQAEIARRADEWHPTSESTTAGTIANHFKRLRDSRVLVDRSIDPSAFARFDPARLATVYPIREGVISASASSTASSDPAKPTRPVKAEEAPALCDGWGHVDVLAGLLTDNASDPERVAAVATAIQLIAASRGTAAARRGSATSSAGRARSSSLENEINQSIDQNSPATGSRAVAGKAELGTHVRRLANACKSHPDIKAITSASRIVDCAVEAGVSSEQLGFAVDQLISEFGQTGRGRNPGGSLFNMVRDFGDGVIDAAFDSPPETSDEASNLSEVSSWVRKANVLSAPLVADQIETYLGQQVGRPFDPDLYRRVWTAVVEASPAIAEYAPNDLENSA